MPKPNLVSQACSPSIQESEARGSQILCVTELQSEFKVSLGNLVRPCLKLKRKPGPRIQFSSWHLPLMRKLLASTLQYC